MLQVIFMQSVPNGQICYAVIAAVSYWGGGGGRERYTVSYGVMQ